MIVGTSENGDSFGNRIVFNTGHGLATFGTNGVSGRNSFGFGKNRVDVFGGFYREEVGHVRG